ncbi:MAG: alpha-L-fucosidase [Planctomycetota bacterium]|nr:MAG: alpha-L-fucosidase [Planctomycetota bacterium]
MDVSRRRLLKATGLAGASVLSSPALFAGKNPRFGSWQIQEPAQQEGEIPIASERVKRFEQMAFGMFVHWGLYSQIAKGEWVYHLHRVPLEDYRALAKSFHAEDFSGRALARAAKRAGMKYVTLTSRHHDGFSLYDTRGLSTWDVTHSAAGRDLILDFCEGCRAEGVVPMLYCTTLDWIEPRFEKDWKAYQEYLRSSIKLLCTEYGPIGGFWFDGNWSKPNADWETDALYGVIRKYQPEALIINNTGIGAGGKIGNPEIDSTTFERGRPEPIDRRGHPKYVAGEMCHTLNFHWGIAERDFNYLSPAHVIEELCGCRRAGANLLMNVGPTASGAVPDYEKALLARVGDWIRMHGGEEGPMYRGRPDRIQGEGRDFGLRLGDEVYLFVFDLTLTADTRAHAKSRGAGPRRFSGLSGKFKKAHWLDNGESLKLEQEGNQDLILHSTGYPYGTNTVVRVARLS